MKSQLHAREQEGNFSPPREVSLVSSTLHIWRLKVGESKYFAQEMNPGFGLFSVSELLFE